MTALDRRRFFQLAGGTSAFAALSGSIARAAGIPAHARTRSLEDVEHIVVLMQENRSFDHYFGTLRGVRGFGDPRPATLPSGKPVWHQSGSGPEVLPFHPTADDLGLQFLKDLPHDWNSTHLALNGGRYDQWVPAKSATSMAYLTRADIPFHYALADAFTICDAYHCSVLGPTDPNRYYLWTGWTGNDGKGGGPAIDNAAAGYSWTTYPERLERAGVSWRIYQDIGDGLDRIHGWGYLEDAYRGNFGCNSLMFFKQYQDAKPGEPLYDKARTGTDAKAGEGFFDRLKADVLGGRLPQVSWVVAPEAFSEHPNWPVNYGAWYIAQLLDALTADPRVWSRTALLITYDENDGFFDHLLPPYPAASAAEGGSTVDTSSELFSPAQGSSARGGPAQNGSARGGPAQDGSAQGSSGVPGPYGLGPRVPMFVVSPWSRGGAVCSQTFDHTSVIQFIERRFGVREPNISPWRRAVCGDLTSAFDFRHGDSGVPRLPDTAGYRPPDRERHPDYVPTPPAGPELPRQEAGVRPARPLPYELAADGRAGADGRLRIDFASLGRAGAHFLVSSPTQADGPWNFTVGAGHTLSGEWRLAAGAYAFAVHGPNGFLREFRGTAGQAGPELTVHLHGPGDELQLVLANGGGTAARLTVRNGYGTAEPGSYQVRPGEQVSCAVRTERSSGWYDLTVTSDQDPGFLRRVAGHVETNAPSTSDPAIATA